MDLAKAGNGALFFLTMLFALSVPPLAVHAEVRYTVTAIGGPDGYADDVNNAGQVVGSLPNGQWYDGYFFDGSTLTRWEAPGGTGSGAVSLNDSGTVVGAITVEGNPLQAISWSNGVVTPLPVTGRSDASGINASGAITGTQQLTYPNGRFEERAYVYANGVVTDLGGFAGNGFVDSHGYAINDAGHVAGSANVGNSLIQHPFLYRDGVMVDLGTFGGDYGYGWAINNHDEVVGTAGTENRVDENGGVHYFYSAFLYSGGVLHNLGALLPPGESFAYDINDRGDVVGFGALGAFLYTDGAMLAINSLLDPAAGWAMQLAFGINDLQQIAGRACRGGECYAVRLDLAPAIPEPTTAFLLGAGLLVLALGRVARGVIPWRMAPSNGANPLAVGMRAGHP